MENYYGTLLNNSYTNVSFEFFDLTDTKNGKQKWEKMLELVQNPNYIEGTDDDSDCESVPFGYIAIAGTLTKQKIRLCNEMVVDWQINHKKKKVKKEYVHGTHLVHRTWSSVYS